jgi:hypothetical protein
MPLVARASGLQTGSVVDHGAFDGERTTVLIDDDQGKSWLVLLAGHLKPSG